VAAGMVLNALPRIHQQHWTRAKNHGTGRAHARASRLQSLGQAIFAELALGHARIESHPLKTRNVIWAGNRAVAAPNAFVGLPADHAGFRIFVQCLEWTSRSARRVQTV